MLSHTDGVLFEALRHDVFGHVADVCVLDGVTNCGGENEGLDNLEHERIPGEIEEEVSRERAAREESQVDPHTSSAGHTRT